MVVLREYPEPEARADSAHDELKASLKAMRQSVERAQAAVDRVDRDRLRGRTASDSPTDTRNLDSASLLKIVLQRTIDGEGLDDECEKVIRMLSKVVLGEPQPTTPTKPQPGRRPQEEGFYRYGTDFVKVVKSQSSDRLYAKIWRGEWQNGGSWDYDPGLYMKLRNAVPLSADDAKYFGKLYGHCIFCGLRLDDERSITAGYGPTCAENRGLPWG